VIRKVTVRRALHVVVVGVRDETTVHPCPSQPVDGILLVLDGLGDDLGVEVVVEGEVKMRLDRETLVEELLEELLADLREKGNVSFDLKGKRGRREKRTCWHIKIHLLEVSCVGRQARPII
jgi:predicted thioredoxin/glutaredoxin